MIVLDDRIGSKELQPYITKPCILDRLEYGDACFTGEGPDGDLWLIGIERKTITDLVSSISTGRLSGHQLRGLLEQYSHIYLLVEGIWRSDPKSKILQQLKGKKWMDVSLGTRRFTAREIHSYLNTMAVICGLTIWKTEGKRQSGQWLGDIYSWWQKPWAKHKSHKQFHVPPVPMTVRKGLDFSEPSTLWKMVKEIDGVGWKKGEEIAKHYGSMMDLTHTTEEELQEVPGIGKKLAKTILDELILGER